jgi:hypothetical protein
LPIPAAWCFWLQARLAFLILGVAKDDSAVILANFNRHDSIITLSSLEHGDCMVFGGLLGVERHLVDDALGFRTR